MKTQTIKQAVTFKASPHDVYEALMDSKKHAQFTGDVADISRKVGGKVTAWGDYIDGVNLELIPDKKIVQTWHTSDWPAEHYSKVTFQFEAVKGGTKLNFTQTGVPAEHYASVKQGWIDYYWRPMKEMLEK